MNALIIRFQFEDRAAARANSLLSLLKQNYGGAVNLIAPETIFLDTTDHARVVFKLLSAEFTFDDKLFVGRLDEFESLHHITRVNPSLQRVAI